MSAQGSQCNQGTAHEIIGCLERSTHLTEALLDLPDRLHPPGDLHLWNNEARGATAWSARAYGSASQRAVRVAQVG